MKNDLVSVIILTYNSGKFITETLEGAKNQTYSNVELIISDDASKDNTIEICEEWIENNKDRFLNIKLLKVDINTGISANYNRGLKMAQGKWVKYCAGDDVLLPYCIEDNLNHVSRNQDIKALFSYCRMYIDNFSEECFSNLNPGSYPSSIMEKNITANEQYKMLLVCNRIPYTPSSFFHLESLKKYGHINELFSFVEDYQLWLSLTKNGIKLFFMEKETIKYRIHQDSVSTNANNFVLNPIYFRTEACIKSLTYPYIPWEIRFSKTYIWYINHVFKINYLNKKNKFNLSLYYFLSKILNPFSYIIYIKSHYYKNNIFYN